MTTPDHPADRDQQQAAEALFGHLPADYPLSPSDGLRTDRVAVALDAARKEGRAEEAARWQAKIEALAALYARNFVEVSPAAVARRLRLLGGEG